MDILDFTRSRALNTIPAKKLQDKLDSVKESSDTPEVKNLKLIAYNRYYESNIPLMYWELKMEKDFIGDPRLKQKYDEYIADLKQSYQTANSFCLAGSHGTGKTTVMTCILKKACQKGYSCLYSSLGDIVAVMTQAPSEDKFLARQELNKVDFLVIDELDDRFMATENAADLFARSLESTFRTRSQNNLPTLICTNSPNVLECFSGALKASLDSLMKGNLKFFTVFGDDHRKKAIK